MIRPGIYYPETLAAGTFSRVVSLVPSLSETMVGLGLAHKLVGRTRFCTSSAAVLGTVPTIGGTKDPHAAAILALQPDLILAVKEENQLADIAKLSEHCPCLVYDIATIADAWAMLQHLGGLLGAGQAAQDLLTQVSEKNVPKHPLAALYLIWQNPYMTIGADTYIADVLTHAGFVLPEPALLRYPSVDLVAFCAEHPVDVILLSSEPYPFKPKHAGQLAAVTQKPVRCVDGQLLSWYGTLTINGLAYARRLYEQVLLALPAADVA